MTRGAAARDGDRAWIRRAVFAAMLAAGISVGASANLAPPPLADVGGVGELKQWFNAQRGHPRLVLLLSPT